MKTFILSDSGRILSLAIGVALAGSGAGKLIEHSAGVAVGCIAMLLAVVLTVIALGTALDEHYGAAALSVVLLPCLAFLGMVGLGLLPHHGGGALMIAALAPVAFAARRHAAPERRPSGLAVARTT